MLGVTQLFAYRSCQPAAASQDTVDNNPFSFFQRFLLIVSLSDDCDRFAVDGARGRRSSRHAGQT
jgi:hypothetical protein